MKDPNRNPACSFKDCDWRCELACVYRMSAFWVGYQRQLEARRQKIWGMYQSGQSVDDIARRLHMHSRGISEFLQHRGAQLAIPDTTIPAEAEEVPA